METAGQAWQTAHSFTPALSEHNKITRYMSLYKVGPKIYRAGFALAAPPVELPEGLKYEIFNGGKYSRLFDWALYAARGSFTTSLRDCCGEEDSAAG